MGLHEFFHHSAIVSCITFHVWKSVDCYFSNKVYRDILRNSYVPTKTLKCLCTLYLKNSNLQIFMHETIAECWKNLCRPIESDWYFCGLDSTDQDHCDKSTLNSIELNICGSSMWILLFIQQNHIISPGRFEISSDLAMFPMYTDVLFWICKVEIIESFVF